MSEIERAIHDIEHNVDCDNRELYLRLLRAELEREKNPLTWNERINQMTVSEKADWMKDNDFCIVMKLPENGCFEFNSCTECLETWLNSPYTEGETK